MQRITDFIEKEIEYSGYFINGKWRMPSKIMGSIEVVSPANIDWRLPDLGLTKEYSEDAVHFAKEAQAKWKARSLEERISYLNRFRDELEKRQERIATLISLEVGKPYDEALGEAKVLLAKIDVTIEEGLKLIQTKNIDLGEGSKGEVHWRPKGVLVVVGPFNFPVHLSHGHIVPALLAGNACILKPTGKAPYCAQAYMEAYEAAGFPDAVLQMLHGSGDVVTDVIRHPDTNGCLATCSFEVGTHIQRQLAHNPEKVVCLEMGGKNAAIIWEHSDVDALVSDLIHSCFLTTGQRCTALSRIYVKRELMDELVAKFHLAAKELSINQPFATDPKPFYGPIINEEAQKRFLKYSDMAKKEGATSIMRPKRLQGSVRAGDHELPEGFYVSPSINVVEKWNRESYYQNHEIFGPDTFFCPIDSIDEGIEATNSNKYGLSFAFYGSQEKDFDYVADNVEVGLAYWNRPTVGASGKLPFGGWKQSGNHHPAGLFAIYGSTQVQARFKKL